MEIDRQFKYQYGITLIEIIIVITIFGLTAGLVGWYLFSFREKQTLIEERDAFIANVRTAQNTAILAQTNKQYIEFISGGAETQYKIKQAPSFEKEITLKHGLEIEPDTPSNLEFKKLSGALDSATARVISIKNTNGTLLSEVTIELNGTIKVVGP